LTSDGYIDAKSDSKEFEKNFKLVTTFKITNMHGFNAEGKIVKYETIGDIIEDYFEVRYEGYEVRKQSMIETLEAELVELSAKAKFIRARLAKTLIIEEKSDEEIVAAMKAHKLPPVDIPSEPENIKAYEYLLKMRIDRVKASAVAELMEQVEKAQQDLDTLRATPETDLWLADLDQFETEYNKMIVARDEAFASADGAAAGGKKKSAKRAAKK
jgi:DNA topoisomerase-2